MVWIDTTSYSRGQKERIPTTFSANVGRLKVTITNDHIFYPGRWVLHCRPFFDVHEMRGVGTVENAQQRAVELIREIAVEIMESLENEN